MLLKWKLFPCCLALWCQWFQVSCIYSLSERASVAWRRLSCCRLHACMDKGTNRIPVLLSSLCFEILIYLFAFIFSVVQAIFISYQLRKYQCKPLKTLQYYNRCHLNHILEIYACDYLLLYFFCSCCPGLLETSTGNERSL